jgi:hypothetical protein
MDKRFTINSNFIPLKTNNRTRLFINKKYSNQYKYKTYMKPFISTAFYGVLNYIIALTLIASPWLFDLVKVSSAALLLPIYIGWLQLIMAIFSNNETGFIKRFPMATHLTIDALMGFVLAVSPWLYTFSNSKINPDAWAPALIFGLLLLFLAIFTKKSPFTTAPHVPLSEGSLISTDSLESNF